MNDADPTISKSDETLVPESPWFTVRQIEKIFAEECALLFGSYAQSQNAIPHIEMNQGDIRIRFQLPRYSVDTLEKIVKIAKRFFTNIRIKTWLNDEYRFQAMPDNIYDKIESNQLLQFTVTGLMGFYHFEARKNSRMLQDDVHFLLDIFRFIHSQQEKSSPEQLLQQLGVVVYKADAAISWDWMAGYEQVKREVMESVILPLRHQEVYQQIAGQTRPSKTQAVRGNSPRAILFNGPPGVGKTTMARMIAHEVGIPLLYIPVESIISKYYGQSSKNLSQIFDIAALMNGAILFLDEIDSLAGSRDANMFEATRRVLSVLLRYLDGFESSGKILTLAATNRKQDLDEALISRFDHTVFFPLPGQSERELIVKRYARQLQSQEIAKIASLLIDFSGRNIKDICDYAERWWARHIILQQLPVTAPPLEAYLKAIESRHDRL